MRTENNRQSLQLGTPLISFSFTEPASENFRSSEMELLEVATTPRAPRLRIEILPWNTTDIVFDGMNRSRALESQLAINRVPFCRTSKMSHDATWRDSWLCRNRDRSWRWLWRLVRLDSTATHMCRRIPRRGESQNDKDRIACPYQMCLRGRRRDSLQIQSSRLVRILSPAFV